MRARRKPKHNLTGSALAAGDENLRKSQKILASPAGSAASNEKPRPDQIESGLRDDAGQRAWLLAALRNRDPLIMYVVGCPSLLQRGLGPPGSTSTSKLGVVVTPLECALDFLLIVAPSCARHDDA